MQDGRDTGGALKPGAGEIEQTLCCGIKEQFIERLLVMEQKGMQFVWKGKDYVVVRHRQKPSQLVLQPPAGMDGLAARAVPVAAAQRNAFALAAVGAFIDRVAERAGPAKSHALENAFFARRQMRVRRQKAGEESAQHGADVSPVWQLLAASRWQIKATGSLANEEGSSRSPLSPLPGGERFGIDQLERGADSNQSGPCHVEIARRGNQASMTEEAVYQGEFHPTLNEMSGKTMA